MMKTRFFSGWLLTATLVFILTPLVIHAQTQEVGTVKHGFKLLWVQDVEEIHAKAHMFEHVQTGAPLLYLSTDDDNKVFSIAFRTPPTDDTGIAHIMEHSVLCGSEKFPTKEPFIDLLKGSLQTFLNAFTSDDRTVYPVASRNDKDFMNLMHVYLDAVFFPNAVKNPETLMQEGWHYQVDPETGDLKYNGIVYNEMKGVYSSPQSVLYRSIQKEMYADSTYTNDSGGNPEAIPNLTFQQFCDFHQKYYHPGNAMIFLYGDGDIDKHLEFIDREYLSRFQRQEIDLEITVQPPFARPKDVSVPYSIDENESKEGKTFLSRNYLLPSDVENVERQFGMDLLCYILIGSDASPLRRALLDAGVGMDIQCFFDSSIKQPVFSIIATNSDPKKKKLFDETIDKTLRELVANGIDRKLIEGAINRTEFQLREFQTGSFPKGLALNMQMLDTWAYGADPLLNLRFEPLLKHVRESVENGYFENLIQTWLLDNPSQGHVMLVPRPGLEKYNTNKLAYELKQVKQSLTSEQLEQIKQKQKQLIARQELPDRPEDVAKIPTLERSDLKPKAEVILFEKTSIGKTPFVNVDVDTNKIIYFDVYFDASRVPMEDAPYVSLLSEILGRVDTENYSYSELNSEIDINTGGIYTSNAAYSLKDRKGEFRAMFMVTTKVMPEKLEKGLELLLEQVNRSQFGDKARLKELIQELRVGKEQALMQAGRGSTYPQLRARSYFSPVDAYNDSIGGVDFYRFLVDLEKRMDSDSDQVVAKLNQCADRLFRKGGNSLVAVTLPKAEFAEIMPVLAKFESQIIAEMNGQSNWNTFPVKGQLNEGAILPSRVQYVVRAGDYEKAGFAYSGTMSVLTNLLRTTYLWDNIRILGGAYGSGITITRSGTVALWSYRDPHLRRTVDVFAGVPEYLQELELSEMELTKAIIATIGSLDRPLTPQEKGRRVASMLFSGLTQDDLQQEWDDVLETTAQSLRNFAPMMQNAIEQNFICVFGNEDKIEADKDLFKNRVRIIE